MIVSGATSSGKTSVLNVLSAFIPETERILVIEDVNEAAHRVDRMLTQLRSAGILRRLAGLAFGQLTAGEDNGYLPEVLADFAEAVPGPVVADLPFGHVAHTISLPVGAVATIDTAAAPASRLRRG